MRLLMRDASVWLRWEKEEKEAGLTYLLLRSVWPPSFFYLHLRFVYGRSVRSIGSFVGGAKIAPVVAIVGASAGVPAAEVVVASRAAVVAAEPAAVGVVVDVVAVVAVLAPVLPTGAWEAAGLCLSCVQYAATLGTVYR
ncbi:unnamed protein product [Parnassius apollo]|uniref:(apollo) hypothetical protein n=1 Tax=Parnassius apollo TaxID=110799 RepID=A0A8S3X1J0_PARAO|nr:unnamed protein product [Parnassius apollo]